MEEEEEGSRRRRRRGRRRRRRRRKRKRKRRTRTVYEEDSWGRMRKKVQSRGQSSPRSPRSNSIVKPPNEVILRGKLED